jgi:hypothetical protein
MSNRESGQFAMMEDRSVPTELTQVPRDNWRNYPPAWGTQYDKPGNGRGNGNGNGRGHGRGNGHTGN